MKPVFIPLKREYFEAFKRGEKTEEFRPLGPRWNQGVCQVGRAVVLSLGYGKAHRLPGVIISFRVDHNPHAHLPGWSACYPMSCAPAACIGITLARRCVVCSARVKNMNPKAKTCGPVCTKFYHEHKEAVDRGEKVLRFEDAVRRDIERAETGSDELDAPPIYYRRNPFRSLRPKL